MTELKDAFREVRDSMIANGFPPDRVDALIAQAARAANEVVTDYADRIEDAPDQDWPNLYVIGMQLIAIFARHHAELFKQRAREHGLVEVKPKGDGADGHAPH